MYVSFIAYPVMVLGPGKRIGIWTMGCNRRCYNCASPFLWEKDEKYNISIENLMIQIESYLEKEQVDGITISGGEPFLQDELVELLSYLKYKGIQDILVYTGNTLEELKLNPKYNEALKYIDVLVDGEYVDYLNDKKNLRGSSNQCVYIFNNSLKEKYEIYLKEERKFQQNITFNNKKIYIGLPYIK